MQSFPPSAMSSLSSSQRTSYVGLGGLSQLLLGPSSQDKSDAGDIFAKLAAWMATGHRTMDKSSMDRLPEAALKRLVALLLSSCQASVWEEAYTAALTLHGAASLDGGIAAALTVSPQSGLTQLKAACLLAFAAFGDVMEGRSALDPAAPPTCDSSHEQALRMTSAVTAICAALQQLLQQGGSDALADDLLETANFPQALLYTAATGPTAIGPHDKTISGSTSVLKFSALQARRGAGELLATILEGASSDQRALSEQSILSVAFEPGATRLIECLVRDRPDPKLHEVLLELLWRGMRRIDVSSNAAIQKNFPALHLLGRLVGMGPALKLREVTAEELLDWGLDLALQLSRRGQDVVAVSPCSLTWGGFVVESCVATFSAHSFVIEAAMDSCELLIEVPWSHVTKADEAVQQAPPLRFAVDLNALRTAGTMHPMAVADEIGRSDALLELEPLSAGGDGEEEEDPSQAIEDIKQLFLPYGGLQDDGTLVDGTLMSQSQQLPSVSFSAASMASKGRTADEMAAVSAQEEASREEDAKMAAPQLAAEQPATPPPSQKTQQLQALDSQMSRTKRSPSRRDGARVQRLSPPKEQPANLAPLDAERSDAADLRGERGQANEELRQATSSLRDAMDALDAEENSVSLGLEAAFAGLRAAKAAREAPPKAASSQEGAKPLRGGAQAEEKREVYECGAEEEFAFLRKDKKRPADGAADLFSAAFEDVPAAGGSLLGDVWLSPSDAGVALGSSGGTAAAAGSSKSPLATAGWHVNDVEFQKPSDLFPPSQGNIRQEAAYVDRQRQDAAEQTCHQHQHPGDVVAEKTVLAEAAAAEEKSQQCHGPGGQEAAELFRSEHDDGADCRLEGEARRAAPGEAPALEAPAAAAHEDRAEDVPRWAGRDGLESQVIADGRAASQEAAASVGKDDAEADNAASNDAGDHEPAAQGEEGGGAEEQEKGLLTAASAVAAAAAAVDEDAVATAALPPPPAQVPAPEAEEERSAAERSEEGVAKKDATEEVEEAAEEVAQEAAQEASQRSGLPSEGQSEMGSDGGEKSGEEHRGEEGRQAAPAASGGDDVDADRNADRESVEPAGTGASQLSGKEEDSPGRAPPSEEDDGCRGGPDAQQAERSEVDVPMCDGQNGLETPEAEEAEAAARSQDDDASSQDKGAPEEPRSSDVPVSAEAPEEMHGQSKADESSQAKAAEMTRRDLSKAQVEATSADAEAAQTTEAEHAEVDVPTCDGQNGLESPDAEEAEAAARSQEYHTAQNEAEQEPGASGVPVSTEAPELVNDQGKDDDDDDDDESSQAKKGGKEMASDDAREEARLLQAASADAGAAQTTEGGQQQKELQHDEEAGGTLAAPCGGSQRGPGTDSAAVQEAPRSQEEEGVATTASKASSQVEEEEPSATACSLRRQQEEEEEGPPAEAGGEEKQLQQTGSQKKSESLNGDGEDADKRGAGASEAEEGLEGGEEEEAADKPAEASQAASGHLEVPEHVEGKADDEAAAPTPSADGAVAEEQTGELQTPQGSVEIPACDGQNGLESQEIEASAPNQVSQSARLADDPAQAAAGDAAAPAASAASQSSVAPPAAAVAEAVEEPRATSPEGPASQTRRDSDGGSQPPASQAALPLAAGAEDAGASQTPQGSQSAAEAPPAAASQARSQTLDEAPAEASAASQAGSQRPEEAPEAPAASQPSSQAPEEAPEAPAASQPSSQAPEEAPDVAGEAPAASLSEAEEPKDEARQESEASQADAVHAKVGDAEAEQAAAASSQKVEGSQAEYQQDGGNSQVGPAGQSQPGDAEAATEDAGIEGGGAEDAAAASEAHARADSAGEAPPQAAAAADGEEDEAWRAAQVALDIPPSLRLPQDDAEQAADSALERAAGDVAVAPEAALQPEEPLSCELKAADGEYVVLIDKTVGGMLGCRISSEGVINGISEDGLVAKWNSSHSEKRVHPGDIIVSVNGIRVDVRQMLGECKKNQVLTILLRRPEASKAAATEKQQEEQTLAPGDLEKMNVKELSGLCKQKGLYPHGRKAELVARLAPLFSEPAGAEKSSAKKAIHTGAEEDSRVRPAAAAAAAAAAAEDAAPGRPPTKKQKHSEDAAEPSAMPPRPAEEDAVGPRGEAANLDLESMTYKDVAALCRKHSVAVGGRKADLIGRLRELPIFAGSDAAEADKPPAGPASGNEAADVPAETEPAATADVQLAQQAEGGVQEVGESQPPPQVVVEESQPPQAVDESQATSEHGSAAAAVEDSQVGQSQVLAAEEEGAEAASQIDASTLPLAELQAACRMLGLPCHGSRNELQARLTVCADSLLDTQQSQGQLATSQASEPSKEMSPDHGTTEPFQDALAPEPVEPKEGRPAAEAAVGPAARSDGLDTASLLRDLETLSVKELRAACAEHGLSITGRKADLIDRLGQLLEAADQSQAAAEAGPSTKEQDEESLWVPPTLKPLDDRRDFDERVAEVPREKAKEAVAPESAAMPPPRRPEKKAEQKKSGASSEEAAAAAGGDNVEEDDIPASLQGLSVDVLQAACHACGLSTAGDQKALSVRLVEFHAAEEANSKASKSQLPGHLAAAIAKSEDIDQDLPGSVPAAQQSLGFEEAGLWEQAVVGAAAWQQDDHQQAAAVAPASAGLRKAPIEEPAVRKDERGALLAEAAAAGAAEAAAAGTAAAAGEDFAGEGEEQVQEAIAGLLLLHTKELQSACQRRGLDTLGSKEELAARLLARYAEVEPTPSAQIPDEPTPPCLRTSGMMPPPARSGLSRPGKSSTAVAPEGVDLLPMRRPEEPLAVGGAASRIEQPQQLLQHHADAGDTALLKRSKESVAAAAEQKQPLPVEAPAPLPADAGAFAGAAAGPAHGPEGSESEGPLLKRPRVEDKPQPQTPAAQPPAAALGGLGGLWRTMRMYSRSGQASVRSSLSGQRQPLSTLAAFPGGSTFPGPLDTVKAAQEEVAAVMPIVPAVAAAQPPQEDVPAFRGQPQWPLAASGGAAPAAGGSRGYRRSVYAPTMSQGPPLRRAAGTCHGWTAAGAPCRCNGSVRPEGARYAYCKKHAWKWARFEPVGVDELPPPPGTDAAVPLLAASASAGAAGGAASGAGAPAAATAAPAQTTTAAAAAAAVAGQKRAAEAHPGAPQEKRLALPAQPLSPIATTRASRPSSSVAALPAMGAGGYSTPPKAPVLRVQQPRPQVKKQQQQQQQPCLSPIRAAKEAKAAASGAPRRQAAAPLAATQGKAMSSKAAACTSPVTTSARRLTAKTSPKDARRAKKLAPPASVPAATSSRTPAARSYAPPAAKAARQPAAGSGSRSVLGEALRMLPATGA
eukprot:TRINITY_DN12390_c0_g2_i1.p1 TRINITY_DN12390_c0_g2~~TRINITY_DN12390_c0_g2_i1.p1  ORF type:complete len:3304 (+),score=1138.40 TRINITY_DN12390_c0_g2_i1:143-10054(+)